MHYFLVTKSSEQIDIMALFSNLRRNRTSIMLFWVEEVQTRSLLYSSWTCFKEKTKEGGRQGTLFATPMIGQGILRGVQTMGHCGGKDGVH